MTEEEAEQARLIEEQRMEQENERKQRHEKMEAEREVERQRIREKVSSMATKGRRHFAKLRLNYATMATAMAVGCSNDVEG